MVPKMRVKIKMVVNSFLVRGSKMMVGWFIRKLLKKGPVVSEHRLRIKIGRTKRYSLSTESLTQLPCGTDTNLRKVSRRL